MERSPIKKSNTEAIFNAGFAKLMRIDQARKDMHVFRIQDQYDNWLDCLGSVRSEIAERWDQETYIESEKKENEIATFINIHKSGKSKNTFLIKKLNEYDWWLAKFEFKYGMSLPNKEDNHGVTEL